MVFVRQKRKKKIHTHKTKPKPNNNNKKSSPEFCLDKKIMEQMCIMLVINMLKEEHTFGRPFAVCLHVFTVYPISK